MSAGPPGWLDTLARILIPPARREDVLGDLHERYRSPGQYMIDLLATAPCVIFSRIRRTTDTELFLTEALLLYASFLATAWYTDRSLLDEPWGLLHLAIPTAITLVFVILEDAWDRPGRRIQVIFAGGPVLTALTISVVPWKVSMYGFYSGLMLVSTVKMLFQAGAGRPQSAGGPAIPVNRKSEPVEMSGSAKLIQDIAITVICFAIAAVVVLVAGVYRKHQ